MSLYRDSIKSFCDPFKKDKRSALKKILKYSFKIEIAYKGSFD